MLYVGWHDDGVPGSDPGFRATLKPPRALVRHYTTVRTYDIDSALVGAGRFAAAHCDIVVPGHSRPVQVRGCRLYLTDHRYLLLEFRHEELISITQNDVRGRSHRDPDYTRHVDHQPPHRTILAQL